ncbi:MAG: hypothetical protein ABSG05_02840 [Candidatus Pacearchaeota archaeon]|jgi:hypothetical protein
MEQEVNSSGIERRVRKGIALDVIDSTPTQKIKDLISESDLDTEYSGFGKAYLNAYYGFGDRTATQPQSQF